MSPRIFRDKPCQSSYRLNENDDDDDDDDDDATAAAAAAAADDDDDDDDDDAYTLNWRGLSDMYTFHK